MIDIDFRSWFESSDPASQIKQQITAIGKKYFGRPNNYNNDDNEIFFEKLPYGRSIYLYWEKDPNTSKYIIDISFDQEDIKDLSSKNQNQEFDTSKSLQPGSIDFSKKLYAFVKELKSLGFGITYATSGKRTQLYDKYLRKANFAPSPYKGRYDRAVWETNDYSFN